MGKRKGYGTGSRSSVKMWGSGTSLSRFELENAGLRNEHEPFWAWILLISGTSLPGELEGLDPFWAWKCVSPERPRTRGAAEKRSGWDGRGRGRRWSDRVQIKKKLKMMVTGTAKSAKNVKWWCSGMDYFGNLWKWYAPEIQGWKWGSLARHIPNMHKIMEVPPPPPPGSTG